MIVFVMFMIIVCKHMVCVTFIFVIIMVFMISIHGIVIHDDVHIVHRPKSLAFWLETNLEEENKNNLINLIEWLYT